MNSHQKEKLLNLMADQVLFGLSEEELSELNELKSLYPEIANDNSLEMAAAALMLDSVKEISPMPADLNKLILDESSKIFDDPVTFQASKEEPQPQRSFAFNLSDLFSNRLGWLIAAAACVMLIFSLMVNLRQPETIIVKEPVKTEEKTIDQKFNDLVVSAKDLSRTALTDPGDSTKVIGELVWSDELQSGFMKFTDLTANDPAKEAYQLWIFDESQEEKTPIDGGVFDIPANEKTHIIAIDAKLKVVKPNLFAVTVEKPGGVVVSKREKIVALGKV